MGIKNILDEVPNNYRTLIGKTYPKSALTKVWCAVSKFIRKNLQEGKGITIKNMGTFTFSEWTTAIGSKTLHTKIPTFVMSEKLVQFYHLNTRVPYLTGKTPIVPLNHATIATNIGTCRQMVEDCVTEITEAFLRLLSQNQDIEVQFSQIGQLQIRNKQIQMNFFPNFLDSKEGSRTPSCKSDRDGNIEDDFRPDGPNFTSSPLPDGGDDDDDDDKADIKERCPCENEIAG